MTFLQKLLLMSVNAFCGSAIPMWGVSFLAYIKGFGFCDASCVAPPEYIVAKGSNAWYSFLDVVRSEIKDATVTALSFW